MFCLHLLRSQESSMWLHISRSLPFIEQPKSKLLNQGFAVKLAKGRRTSNIARSGKQTQYFLVNGYFKSSEKYATKLAGLQTNFLKCEKFCFTGQEDIK